MLEAADVAIFAADIAVREKERFAHLPLVTATVKDAIRNAAKLIEEAEAKVSAQS